MSSSEVVLPPHRFWATRTGGQGTPVVLIHGLGGSSDWWRRNVDALAREHVVAAVDLIGFGRNRFFMKPSSLPLGFADVAALLGRWIESAFDGPVHLVGNSMGGHIAIYLAALRPDLVRSLTLVDSTGIPFELRPGLHLANLAVPVGAFSFAHILARDAFRSGPTSLAVALGRIMRDDARELMRGIRVPTLLLWGEHDPLVPLEYGEQMAAAIPGARLVVVPRAGHIPMWENAEFFNGALINFLREADSHPGSPLERELLFSWPLAGWIDGMAHRAAGTRRDAVLVHGLGMSSRYLEPFARALFARNVHAIGPDLRGFGESANAPSMTPDEHARLLTDWADALSIRDALWIGHSHGCNVVAHVAAIRPDLVQRAVCIGPLWTRHRHPVWRLFTALTVDALREPPTLYGHVVPAYWRAGIGRWWMTFRLSLADIASPAPDALMLAGARDPLPSIQCVRVPGAHACLYSDPDAVADAVLGSAPVRTPAPH